MSWLTVHRLNEGKMSSPGMSSPGPRKMIKDSYETAESSSEVCIMVKSVYEALKR